MKVIKETQVKGKRRLVIELECGEKLIPIQPDQYYELGHPHGDVVGGHVMTEAVRVSWCSIEQKWVH